MSSRPLWRSPTLRVAAVYGIAGAGFAGANLLLARQLTPQDFALFSLVLSLLNLSAPLAPIGVDGLVNRYEMKVGPELLGRVLATSLVVSVVTVILGRMIYEIGAVLLLVLSVGIVAGGANTLASAQFQALKRFRVSLALRQSANVVVLVAALATLFAGVRDPLLPLIILVVGRVISALIGWVYVLREPGVESGNGRFTWPEALSFAGVSAAGLLLVQLDRLMIPRVLTWEDLALFSVVAAVVAAPFRVLQMGIGYTLLPNLRTTRSVVQRRRMVIEEGGAAAVMVGVASVAIWFGTPPLVELFVGDKYSIPGALVLAVLITGLAKIFDAFAKTVVAARGTARQLTYLNLAGWLAVAVAILGGVLGSRWGLPGLIYGIGAGWWVRGVIAAFLAVPHLRESPAAMFPVKTL